jgi:hypothetical protein
MSVYERLHVRFYYSGLVHCPGLNNIIKAPGINLYRRGKDDADTLKKNI